MQTAPLPLNEPERMEALHALEVLDTGPAVCERVILELTETAVVTNLIDVARVVGLKTVAEFVENEAIRGRMAELGVDLVQGYAVHRPGPLPTSWPEADPRFCA